MCGCCIFVYVYAMPCVYTQNTNIMQNIGILMFYMTLRRFSMTKKKIYIYIYIQKRFIFFMKYGMSMQSDHTRETGHL